MSKFGSSSKQFLYIKDDISVRLNESIWDEARYNLATHIMSNGVELIIASDNNKIKNLEKSKANLPKIYSNFSQQANPILITQAHHKPLTLSPSTLQNQMKIFTLPLNNQNNLIIPENDSSFVTKICLTTYAYRTSFVKNGTTHVESKKMVVTNSLTEEKMYSHLIPDVTFSKVPELIVGVFPTTYHFYNTFDKNQDSLPLVINSKYTITNTITEPPKLHRHDSKNSPALDLAYGNGFLNTGIPIRPGEVITASADVIFGRRTVLSGPTISTLLQRVNLKNGVLSHTINMHAAPITFKREMDPHTTDSSKNEICVSIINNDTKLEETQCVCRASFGRMFPDRPCKPTYTYEMQIQANFEENNLRLIDIFKNDMILLEAADRMLMQSDLRDIYYNVQLKAVISTQHNDSFIVQFILQLSENSNENRLKTIFQKYLRQSNFSIGNTGLYSSKNGLDLLDIKDFDECVSENFNDCSINAHCFNLIGSYTCSCKNGHIDISDNALYPGRICSDNTIGCDICNYHGKCIITEKKNVKCMCHSWYAGHKCKVNIKIIVIFIIIVGTILAIFLLFYLLLINTI
ncbi:uncharacterized protein LOC110185482 [Drosophila serrata]|uniref:uncharacterized protein LOC110185482 n=1 Tax=Drosophila serrata TaxID=7274 RepID=UPI000A1D0573|nr:uncharacterized protein LOC110185482 [Drosophila serrata]